MLVRLFSGALLGVDALKIAVEVSISQGIRFFIVGLADNAIRESQQRMESALTQSGFEWPHFRVVINLSPANLRKEGSHYDLPLALGILSASGQLDISRLKDYLIMGELSLDGELRPVRGVLPLVLMARREGFRGVLVPHQNRVEAAVVKGLEVVGAGSLSEAVSFLEGKWNPEPDESSLRDSGKGVIRAGEEDYAEVRGQEGVKRALMIAAAGKHNLLMSGSPGSGKSMMARRLPSILPSMEFEEALDTTVVYSVSGHTNAHNGLIQSRPFRAPHHSTSGAAMVGGGASPLPGEISLAHNGVLFLDELPEFNRQVLELLRQPLEEGKIQVNRARYRVCFPADFILVAAMNPCPCGFLTHPVKACQCGPGDIRRYMSRISGPLLDRFDMHLEVVPVSFKALAGAEKGMGSSEMHRKVWEARELQRERFSGEAGVRTNGRMGPALRRKHCVPDRAGFSLLRHATEKLGLSARAYDRILKVARTIADLDSSTSIRSDHVAEAVAYRNLDRESSLL